MNTVFQLVKRNAKVYLRDRAGVFFSLLAPLIVLLLYLFFLRNSQVDSLTQMLDGIPGFSYAKNDLNFFIDTWMICGVLATGIITVPLGAMQCILHDRLNKVSVDFSITPVKGWQTTLGYFISFVLTSFLMMLVVLIVGIIYLAIATGATFSAAAVFSAIGLMLLGSISSALILMLIVSFFRSDGAFTGFSVIMGTVIGFLVGAYMPLTLFPVAVQTISAFIPGTHMTALIKNSLMSDIMERLFQGMSVEQRADLATTYGLNLNFAGSTIPYYVMYIVIASLIVLFAVINFIRFQKRRI